MPLPGRRGARHWAIVFAPTPAAGRPRRRRPLTWVAVVAGAWALLAAFYLVTIYLDLRAGLDAVERAEEESDPSDILDGVPGEELASAEVRFARAHRRASGLTLLPVRLLPIAGRQLRSVASLSAAAEEVSEVGRDALDDARTVLDRERFDGPERVTIIRRLGSIAAGVRDDLADVDLGTDEALIDPLRRRRDEFDERLADLRRTVGDAVDLTEAVADLLEGPSRYLLLAANNAEMRAGSGTFLSAGIVTMGDGRFSIGDLEPTGDLLLPEDRGVAMDPDVEANWGSAGPNREWRNLALTPRFDVSAEMAAAMWQVRTGETVDGVIAVDVEALRAILQATGPVTVDGLAVGDANVVDLLLHDQYLELGDSLGAQAARRDRLSGIAEAAVEAIEAGSYDLPALADGLADAARGRHVLVWSADDTAQEAWEAASVGGTLSEASLLVALLNRGGNKLDKFIEMTHRLSTSERDGVVEVAIEVTVTNHVGPGEPPYVAGPHPLTGLREGEYDGVLAFTLPAAAGEERLDGDLPIVVAGRDGMNGVIGARLRLMRGQSMTVTLRFGMPLGAELRLEPSARLPAPNWRSDDEEWNDAVPRTVPLS